MAATHEDRNAQLSPGVAIKAPCKAATTAAITLSGEQTIDGVGCVDGDRVLVKNQSDQTTNGIYDVNTGSWDRAQDFDGNRDVVTGTFVFITSGATNAGAFYECTAANPVTFGSSALTFAVGALGPIAIPLAASLVTFTPSGAGAVARTVQAKLRDIVSVKDFGAVGDGVTNDTAAIQAVINSVALTGGLLFFPPGTYNIGTTTLVFKNNIHYLGSMRESIISYTGSSDAVQVNNPLNTSTTANIVVEKLTFTCTTRTANKASFADTGSAVISWIDCTFQGNDFGLILDQSNLANIVRCIFTLPTNGTASVWGTNGADRSVGASPLFTNRLTFRDNLFLSAGTAGAGVALDGGVEYIFDGNQFEGFDVQARFTGCIGLALRDNWFELPTTNCIAFKTAQLKGGAGPTITCDGVQLRGSQFVTTGAKNSVLFDASSVISLENVGNNFSDNNAGAAPFTGLVAGVSVLYGFNNSHPGSGGTDVGNSATLNGPFTLTGQFACGITSEANVQAKVLAASTSKALKLVRNDAGVSGNLVLEIQNGSGGGTTVFSVDSIGDIRFGTNTAKAAEAFSSFITIKDAGGTTRKLMVCA